ncbi:MAG: RNA methyltransferase [Anaerolineae bacterium]|jgi:TrmH family RNA methyltransferase|nr:RNA methyltransferase [Anaerolineae bacterium]
MPLHITSLRNPRIKALRALRLRKVRQQERRFLVEGIRIVEEAFDLGAPVETLVYAPDLLVSARARELVERAAGVERLEVSAEVLNSLSDREQSQGLAAVVRIEDRPLSSIPGGESLLAVVAYQLQDPGNLGSIVRTADAAGASGVVVVAPSADLYDPQAVRATMGSLFALPIVWLDDPEALLSWFQDLRGEGLPLLVVASSAHGRDTHYDVGYCRPLVLLAGSERYGLPAAVREAADVDVRLPMAGRATSLNVSAATAALLYEILRQRLSCPPLSGSAS